MKRVILSSFTVASAALFLTGCGGTAVNQDGRYVYANRTLEQVARVRVAMPFVEVLALHDKASRMPPPLPSYDSYLKLWYVILPSPLALMDAAPGIEVTGYNYYEDQKLTKPAGSAIYTTIQRDTGATYKIEEEFTKGTRAGQKVLRTTQSSSTGSTSEFEYSDSTVPDTHKGTEIRRFDPGDTMFTISSTVQGVDIQTTAKLGPLGIMPSAREFTGTFTVQSGASVEWKDTGNAGGQFKITGTGVALPATGTFDASGNGTITYADGVIATFKIDTKGVRFN